MRGSEYYRPQPMAANSSYEIKGSRMAGFLGTVAGTITVTAKNQNGGNVVVLNAMPIDVGATSIPILFPSTEGATVQLGGGAAGTLLI